MDLPDSLAPAPAVLKISGPPDIVGLIPVRLGFRPTESLVVIGLNGERHRLGAAMRFDLPPIGRYDTVLCEEVTRLLCRQEADGALVAVYSEDADPAHGLLREPLIRELRRALRRAEVDVLEALLVKEGRWWSYLCRRECCPAEGTPIPEALSAGAAAFAAEAVAEGRVTRTDRAELEASVQAAADLATPEGVLAWEAQADEVVWELFLQCRDDWPDAFVHRALDRVDRLATRWAAGDCALSTEDAVLITASLVLRAVRDRVLTLLLEHDDAVLAALFTELARRTPDTAAAPVCTALAWFAYASGDGALANVALERAFRVDPQYGLAHLIAESLRQMNPPAVIRTLSAAVRADLDAGRRAELWDDLFEDPLDLFGDPLDDWDEADGWDWDDGMPPAPSGTAS